jgi:precorrin-4/cobalt-precorrin-4 C11-methyltransferase
MGCVWFVGAGPGDPDLITVKGRRLVEQAGAILYAGSLVAAAATRFAPPGCVVADSKSMTLEAIVAWLLDAAGRCETVVRLQTGDPGLYGALTEMARPLDAAGIPWQVVPGVTSAMASAAAAGESLTLPEVTQTVILTRTVGRTPMPDGESLTALAAHGCTLCIYLSATLVPEVQEALTAAGWPPEAPVLVVQKATWPGEEQIIRGCLDDIGRRCRDAGVRSQAMIIASPALGARDWPALTPSRLYDPAFAHRFRRAVPAAPDPDPL